MFLATLHRQSRDDLWLIDGPEEFIRMVIDQQRDMQTTGYEKNHPDAMDLVIEKLGVSIGRVRVSFMEREVRVLEIALLPEARQKGFGTAVLRALQQAATRVMTPLTLCVMRHNPAARTFYHTLGFRQAASHPMFDLLVWLPPPQPST
ncbi:MAG: GNAT family N-acetyltransferase [Magnetococcales bacterium]|nr:GNAT family N-acetyltransferase [Magnetococcales bacterium]